MSILNYEILNPKTDNKRPFLLRNGLFCFHTDYKNIKYYLECARIENYERKYYLLVGETKFDKNCRLCSVDDYGRCKIKIKGELKNYIESEIKERGNINVEEINNNGLCIVYLIE